MSARPSKKITFEEWEQAHQSALICFYLDFIRDTKPASNDVSLKDFEWYLFGQSKRMLKS